MNASHFSGRASSGKMASTGHSGSQAPQSMHSSGSMISMRSNSWMQSTGHTSTHERSLMSMQGSAMMYVTAARVYPAVSDGRRGQLGDDLGHPLGQRRLHEHLVEAGRVRALEAGFVGVVREADDRDIGPGVGDLLRLDPGDVADDEVGWVDAV